jgi:hypothetical protein
MTRIGRETLKPERLKAEATDQSFLQEVTKGTEHFPGGLETVALVYDRQQSPISMSSVQSVAKWIGDRGGSERSLTADYADDADGEEKKSVKFV